MKFVIKSSSKCLIVLLLPLPPSSSRQASSESSSKCAGIWGWTPKINLLEIYQASHSLKLHPVIRKGISSGKHSNSRLHSGTVTFLTWEREADMRRGTLSSTNWGRRVPALTGAGQRVEVSGGHVFSAPGGEKPIQSRLVGAGRRRLDSGIDCQSGERRSGNL